MFAAHAKRVAVERVNAVKNAIISGFWGNSNFDEEDGAREQALRDLDERFDEVIGVINGTLEKIEIDEDNPFYAAMKVPEIDPTLTPEQIEALEKAATR